LAIPTHSAAVLRGGIDGGAGRFGRDTTGYGIHLHDGAITGGPTDALIIGGDE